MAGRRRTDGWVAPGGLYLPILLLLAIASLPAATPAPSNASRGLSRSSAKRWSNIRDVARHQISLATRQFLEQRQQRLTIPLEIDLLLLGFDGDGAYHYSLSADELLELLSSQFVDRELCPTIWETGHTSSTCVLTSFLNVNSGDPLVSLRQLEVAIRAHMKPANLPDQSLQYTHLPAYNVDAAEIEEVFRGILEQAYHYDGLDNLAPGASTDHRLAIIVINPSKERMSPVVDEAAGEAAWAANDIMDDWFKGKISSRRLQEVEAYYSYRYTYNGVGASGAWLSQHNFLVIDVSAGPTLFGPLTNAGGKTTPVTLPRIYTMLDHLAHEVETQTSQVTLSAQLQQAAVDHHRKMFAGQLAACIGAATEHVFTPDIALNRLELGATILVNLIVLHDHSDFNMVQDDFPAKLPGVQSIIDINQLFTEINRMLPPESSAVIMPSDSNLEYHPEVLAALARARTSWSDPVMRDAPYAGLHRTQHSRLDSRALIAELKHIVPEFAEEWDGWDFENHRPHGSLAASVRHNGTRPLNVLLLSLKSAPPGLMFEDGQLVAASPDLVVVLHLVKAVPSAILKAVAAASPSPPAPSPDPGLGSAGLPSPDIKYERWAEDLEAEGTDKLLRLYSGHMQDGAPLELHGAAGVEARIMAGVATALGGLAYPWEKARPELGGQHVKDWRWAVGCLPWGPYGNCSQLSGVLRAAVHRNHLTSHVDTALQHVQSRIAAVDEVVADLYGGPLQDLLFEADLENRKNVTSAQAKQHRWLDTLASRIQHSPDNPFTPNITARLSKHFTDIENTLDELAWALFTHTPMSSNAGGHIHHLLQLADELSLDVDDDIEKCQEVAACCAVRHGAPFAVDVLAIVVFAMLLLMFGIAAFIALSAQKTYRVGPPSARVSGSGGFGELPVPAPPSRRVSRAGSADRRASNTGSGLLPLWGQGPAGGPSLLPR